MPRLRPLPQPGRWQGRSQDVWPSDPVDLSRTGSCWCDDNRQASRTLVSWLVDADHRRGDKNYELLAGSIISHTEDAVSQKTECIACPATMTDEPPAVSDESRHANTRFPFHPSDLRDGITARDQAIREEPFIHMLRHFCELPADKIFAIYSKPPLRSCFPNSNNTKANTASKIVKKVGINDTSGYGYAARYPTLNKRKTRPVPTSRWDNWTVDDAIYRQWISDNSRANRQIAYNIAEDLEFEVWREWTETEFGLPEGSADSAPGTPRSKNRHRDLINPRGAPVTLGRLRFIMDTGSGHHLVCEKYVRGAGALGKVQPLTKPVVLNTAGGPSRALGHVNISSDCSLETLLTSLVLSNTPNVISVGGLVIDHGFSFFWVPLRDPFLIAPNGKRINLVVEGNIPYLYSRGALIVTWSMLPSLRMPLSFTDGVVQPHM